MPIGARCTIKPLTTAELTAAKNHHTYGLVSLVGMTDVTELRPTLREIHDSVGHLAHPLTDPHHIDESGALRGGRRHRLDPDLHTLGAQIADEFETSGLTAWADEFAATAIPTLSEITGYHLTYDRPFMLVYREGDYIAPHGGKYDGHRVNVQIAVPYDTVSCMRVLKDGFLEPQHDNDGGVRLLGARMWHEVSALVRLSPDADPLRLVLTLRMLGTPTDPGRDYSGQMTQPR